MTERPDFSSRRRAGLYLLAASLLVLLLGMSAFNAFNLAPPRQDGPLAGFAFTGLTVFLFILLLVLLVLLVRSLLKLIYNESHAHVVGSRLRSRMLFGAFLLSFAPTLFMALFSYLLMNRSIDRWFSQPVTHLRSDALNVALQLTHYVSENAESEAEAIAQVRGFPNALEKNDPDRIVRQIRNHRVTLEGGFVFIYRDGKPVASYQAPAVQTPPVVYSFSAQSLVDGTDGAPPQHLPAPQPPTGTGTSPTEALASTVLQAAQSSERPILSLDHGASYGLGQAPVTGGGVVVVALPMPGGLQATVDNLSSGARDYWSIYRERRTLRRLYMLLLALVTILTFFASAWLALFLAKQITRPLEALAMAMEAIARGDYQQRVPLSATEELSELIAAFNQMATDLEQSRGLAKRSTTQLEDANRSLDERRRELELILETIPSGVVVLDGARNVLQVNRAFLHLIPPHPRAASARSTLDTLIPAEILEEVLRLERRAQRMGVAGVELEVPLHAADGHAPRETSRHLSLSITVAVLSLKRDAQGHELRGSVLVVDDISELLQAQRQVAWKEVAQRVAHEIKNPLTPISLSAERIRRHLDRGTPDSPSIIRKCSEVILGSVESMRALVDQFAALAEFPAAQPRSSSLNDIVESALLLFHGRLGGIRVETLLSENLPPVMADPDALRRALANLIDNAAEAMSTSFVRVLRVETSLGERSGMAEIVVSDTGPGLSPEARERLFLPYFSTKQRGTGLGLAIAAKIAQDHKGSIRAEQRGSSGASFILEVPLARIPELSATSAPEDVPA